MTNCRAGFATDFNEAQIERTIIKLVTKFRFGILAGFDYSYKIMHHVNKV